MWPKFLNSKWFASVIMSVVTLLIFIIGQSIFAKNRRSDRIDKKADIEYVDKQDNSIKDSVSSLRDDFDKNVVEINTNLREIRNYIYGKKPDEK